MTISPMRLPAAIAAASLILLAIATPGRSVAQPAPVRRVRPSRLLLNSDGRWRDLAFVTSNFPVATAPSPRGADAINNDCLLCHSAGMVLDQAKLSRAEWQTEVDKMRDSFKAPFAAEDIRRSSTTWST